MRRLKNTILLIISFLSSLTAQPVSQYNLSELEPNTVQLLNSVFALMDTTFTYIAHEELENCAYLEYWNKHHEEIPEKDFFNLIYHESPVIRYHSYRHILENKLASSPQDFIFPHLADLETVLLLKHRYQLNELVWKLDDVGRWVKVGPGSKPLILHVIGHTELSEEDSEALYQSIIKSNKPSAFATELSLAKLNANESNYPVIKMMAHKNNNTAIALLTEYQKEENQDFLLSRLDSVFHHNTDRENRRFIIEAVKYDYPRGALEKFHAYYEMQKERGNNFYKRYKYLYEQYAKNQTPIKIQLFKDLFQKAENTTTEKRRDLYKQIAKELNKIPDEELLDYRIEFWRKSGRLDCSTFHVLKRSHPDIAFEIAQTELDKIEQGTYRHYNCFSQYIYRIAAQDLSPEKYLHWALQSTDRRLPNSVLLLPKEYHYSSSKPYIFQLMTTDNTPLRVRSIIKGLVHYDLSEEEREHIVDWVKPYRGQESHNSFHVPLDKALDKLGIK